MTKTPRKAKKRIVLTPVALDACGEEVVQEKPQSLAHVMWTGGFDSTALVMQYLRAGTSVQPYYMRHSSGYPKTPNELKAQHQIREAAALLYPKAKLHKSVEADFDQLCIGADRHLLLTMHNEMATVLDISYQYTCLRFAMDVFCPDLISPIELAVVIYDDLWEHLLKNTKVCHLASSPIRVADHRIPGLDSSGLTIRRVWRTCE